MLLFVHKVFEGIVAGTDSVYTEAIWNDVLGSADQLSVEATAEQVAGTSPSWTIRSEHSNDGRNWFPTGFLAEVSGSISAGVVNLSMGGSDHTNTIGAFVRYNIALGAADNQAMIRLIVAGRGDQPVNLHLPRTPRP